MPPLRLRRSELSTPGSNDSMMAKAAASNADLVFLDLEDAVAPSEKVPARARVVKALRELDWGRKTRAVRINNIETEWCHDDLLHVVTDAGEFLDVIIVPKVKRAEDVRWVDVLLTQLEMKLKRERKIGLEVLIEEVEAMIHAEEIAAATPRLEALIFGPGDFSASQGVEGHAITGSSQHYPGDVWHYARNKVVIAARAAGIEAVDGPYPNFQNGEDYRKECVKARTLGFVGKWAIHPSQIDIANEAFAPTAGQVERARKMVTAYGEAEANGLGAVAVDGVMIDAASVRAWRNILQRGELLGL